MKSALLLVLLAALGCEGSHRFVPIGDGVVALDTKTGLKCNPTAGSKSGLAHCYALYKGTATNPDNPQDNIRDQEKPQAASDVNADLPVLDGRAENAAPQSASKAFTLFETPDDFAMKVKAKYPEYQNMDNTDLARRILSKYPVYWDGVNADNFHKAGIFPSSKPGPNGAPAPVDFDALAKKYGGVLANDAESKPSAAQPAAPGQPGGTAPEAAFEAAPQAVKGAVPMLDPQGIARMVPPDKLDAATKAGGRLAYKMLDATGTARWVPKDKVGWALKNKGKWLDDAESERYRLNRESK